MKSEAIAVNMLDLLSGEVMPVSYQAHQMLEIENQLISKLGHF